MKRWLAFIVISTLGTGGARAQAEDAPSKIFQSYGLVGTWSPGCGRPAGPINPHVRYEQRPDGLVDSIRDLGVDGLSHSTILKASLDQDHRLYTTSYTRFAELPKGVREVIGATGVTPDVTIRNISVRGADGGITVVDQVAEMLGGSRTMHFISEGFFIDQKTHEPRTKAPTSFRCPE